ncbi:hypothetical protein [Amycolatopsis pigmentata]
MVRKGILDLSAWTRPTVTNRRYGCSSIFSTAMRRSGTGGESQLGEVVFDVRFRGGPRDNELVRNLFVGLAWWQLGTDLPSWSVGVYLLPTVLFGAAFWQIAAALDGTRVAAGLLGLVFGSSLALHFDSGAPLSAVDGRRVTRSGAQWSSPNCWVSSSSGAPAAHGRSGWSS